MGFGSRFAQDAAAEQAAQFRKDRAQVEKAGDEVEEGVVAPSASRPTPAATPAARNPAAAFSRSAPTPAAPTASPSRPTSFGASAANARQAAPVATPAVSPGRRPIAFGQGAGFQQDVDAAADKLRKEQQAQTTSSRPTSFGGVRTAAASSESSEPRPSSFRQAPSENGEPRRARVAQSSALRLENLIEEVAAYRNATPEDIEKVRRAAEKNPEATLARLQKIYEVEVKPFKEKNATDITAARVLHPDDVVFSITIGAKQKLQVIPRADATANGLALLDGAHVVSQPAENTPFARPSALFGVGAGIRNNTSDLSSDPSQAPQASEAARAGPRP